MGTRRIIREIRVPSSRGSGEYTVREWECLDDMGSLHFESDCTCKGYLYRGTCRHLAQLDSAVEEQAEERR